MPQFISDTELNLALEQMIKDADNYLWFISPYIKLHDRIKDELKRKMDNYNLEIIIVFGKNENAPRKSISPDDIEFLKSFPNIQIYYSKNFHAKFYTSEDFSLITSMNLHEYSQNINKEIGIILRQKTAIKALANFATNASDAGDEAFNYFNELIESSEELYIKEPVFESTLLGFGKKKVH